MPQPVSERGWRTYRFDEMATMVNDRVDDPSQAGVDYYVGLEHLDSESLTIRRWGSPSDVEATKLRFRAGDIIFGRRRVYQRKLGVAHFDGICSAHAMVLRAKPAVALPEFLPFFMQSDLFMERAREISVGSLSPTINWKTLADEEFALPRPEEQQSIAAALRSAAALREALRDVLDEAPALHSALLASLHASREFEQVRLGSLLRAIVPGKSLVGADTPPLDGEYGVLKVSAVDPHGFRARESKRLLAQEDFLPDLGVRAGDLLMTRANTPELVGEVCLVDGDHSQLMLSDKTLRLEPAPDVDIYLLWESLQSHDVRQQLRAVATGTGRAMKNISQPTIRDLTVAYPRSHVGVAKARATLLGPREAIRLAQIRNDECIALIRFLSERLVCGVES